MFPKAMRKRILCALLTALLLLVASFALAEGYSPIRISTQAEPQTLTGPQSVTVTVRVVNNGEGEISNPITIYDPNGNQVAQWGSLSIGQSQSWQGSWDVTQEQLDAGRLRYSVSYTTYDGEGNAVPTTSTASVTVQKESASPSLTASYTISPTIAQEGQEVKVTYTLSNTGNVDLTHVRITNTGIDQRNINISGLSVGEKITREYTFEMGSKNLTSNPKVTYQAEGSDTVLTYAKMAQKTIEVAEGGLELDLSSDVQEEAAKPGDTVVLTLTLKNTSNLTYSKLSIADANLGTIESDIEVKPGETREITREVIVQDSQDYQFTVTGASSSGTELEVSSNELSVEALDMGKVVSLEVSADTEALVMYEEPSVVRFAVTVKNTGTVAGTNLQVRHGNTTIATIDSLPAGEEVTIVRDLAASMAGTFQFTVVSPAVEAAEGVEAQSEVSYTSNTLRIAYQEPTPVPVTPPPATPEPVVTPDPNATVEPDVRDEQSSTPLGFILLCVFAVLLVAALIAVLVLILLGRQKQARETMVIDSYERANARPYMLDERTRRKEEARRRNAEREQARRQQEDEESAEQPAQPPRSRRNTARREESKAQETKPQPFTTDEEAFGAVFKRPVEPPMQDEDLEAIEDFAAEEKAVEAVQPPEQAHDVDAPQVQSEEEKEPIDQTMKLDRAMLEEIRRSAERAEPPTDKTGKYDLKTLNERMQAEGKDDLSEEKPRRKRGAE